MSTEFQNASSPFFRTDQSTKSTVCRRSVGSSLDFTFHIHQIIEINEPLRKAKNFRIRWGATPHTILICHFPQHTNLFILFRNRNRYTVHYRPVPLYLYVPYRDGKNVKYPPLINAEKHWKKAKFWHEKKRSEIRKIYLHQWWFSSKSFLRFGFSELFWVTLLISKIFDIHSLKYFGSR